MGTTPRNHRRNRAYRRSRRKNRRQLGAASQRIEHDVFKSVIILIWGVQWFLIEEEKQSLRSQSTYTLFAPGVVTRDRRHLDFDTGVMDCWISMVRDNIIAQGGTFASWMTIRVGVCGMLRRVAGAEFDAGVGCEVGVASWRHSLCMRNPYMHW